MAGLLGGGGGGGNNGGGGGGGGLLGGYYYPPFIFHYTTQAYSPSLLNTVDQTTKDLPIVGGITSPLLKNRRGV